VGVAGGLPAGLVAVGVTRRRGRKPRARIAAEKDRVERPPVPGAVRAELQRARQELQEVNRQLEEARRQLVQIREEIQTAGGEAQVTEIKVPVSPEQGTAARPE
jgi:hypothetical protein